MTFGKRLSAARNEKRLTQKTMAELLGMSQPAYSKYEYDMREPNLETLKSISNTLGLSLDYLIKGQIEGPSNMNIKAGIDCLRLILDELDSKYSA